MSLGDVQHKLEAIERLAFSAARGNRAQQIAIAGRCQRRAASLAVGGGGWLWRRALVMEPEVLLLDEPTNHLDFESIAWLEEQLLNFSGAVLFVTHDRAFLQKLATRISRFGPGPIDLLARQLSGLFTAQGRGFGRRGQSERRIR